MKIARFTHSAAALAGLVTSAFGLYVLAMWALGRWRWVSLRADAIPMAPMTALLFLGLGLALVVRVRGRQSPVVRMAIVAGAALTMVVALLVELQAWHFFALPWDNWSFGDPFSTAGMMFGRISILTAVAFQLTAVAFLAQSPRFSGRMPARWIGALAGGAAMVVGAVVLFGYLSGAPLQYGGREVPMALLTALGFIVLNTGILLIGEVGQLLRDWFARDLVGAGAGLDRIGPRRLLLAVAAIGLFVLLAGFFYFRSEVSTARVAVHAQLLTIVDLKVSEIVSWRRERLADARTLMQVPRLAEAIAGFAENPAVTPATSEIAGYLNDYRRNYDYRSIVVLDRQLAPVVAFPAEAAQRDPLEPALRRDIVIARDVVIQDLHRRADGVVELDLVVPVRAKDGDRFVGAIVMSVDTRTLLFPLVQRWPTPSKSAETLLVRREGEFAVFLNELRHRGDAALSLRLPLTRPGLLAAAALAQGQFGLLEGVDYREVPVLGVAREVAGTPWVLLGKMDREEAYQPVQQTAWRTGWVLVLTVLAVVVAMFSLWSMRRRELERRRLHAERERQAAVARLGVVMRHANDAILILDAELRVVEGNQRAVEIFGYPLDALREWTAGDLLVAEAGATAAGDFAAALRGSVVFAALHRRQDGSELPMEVSAQAVELEGRPHVLAILRDITERKVHEQELERLNRMYLVISEVNQALMQMKSMSAFFTEICQVLVKRGGFKIAWIGWLDTETHRLTPTAVEGDEHGYVAGLDISLDTAQPQGRGPSATAFREGRTYVCNDFFGDPLTQPWREAATRSGLRSSLALPLRLEGKVMGLLTVYAVEQGFFHPREIELLEEAAADLSFGLGVFAAEVRSREAAAALRISEERLRLALAAGRLGLYDLNVQTGEAVISPEYATMLGYDPARFRETNAAWIERLHPEDKEAVAAQYQDYVSGRTSEYRVEFRQRMNAGGWKWILAHGRVAERSPEGKPLRMVGTHTDISVRKAAEKEIRVQSESLRARNEELTRFNRAAVDRELRMVELKREINDLCARLGEPPRHRIADSESAVPTTGSAQP